MEKGIGKGVKKNNRGKRKRRNKVRYENKPVEETEELI